MMIKVIEITDCYNCPYNKTERLGQIREDEKWYTVSWCTHPRFCVNIGNHQECTDILITRGEGGFQDIVKELYGFPEWCPLDNR